MDEELKLLIKAYDEFTGIMARFNSGLEKVEKAEKAVLASTDAMNRALDVFGTTVQKTGPPTEQAAEKTEKLKHAHDEAAEAAKKHKQHQHELMEGMMTAIAVLAALQQSLKAITTAGAAFDRELGIMQGLTGESSDSAREFLMNLEGQRRTVTDLALGMNELARAGFSAGESMRAIPELAVFAQAGMMDLEKATAPVTTVLKAFGIETSRVGEITDALTMAANRSALGFDDFQLGLAMSAGAAKLAGQGYTELIAVLSVLRDAGLGASDAGTSIKSAWLALMNPSEEAKTVMKDLGIAVYDTQGRMKSWADIVDEVDRAIRPLNDQSRNLALTTIFGSDGIRAMSMSLGRGSEYIRALTADMKSAKGTTAELAHEMGNTFTGSLERTQANLERMKILVFEDLRGAMTGLLDAVDTLIVGFNSLPPSVRGIVEILAGSAGLIAAVAAAALLIKTMLIPGLKAMQMALTETAVAAGTAKTAIAALGGPTAIAVAALSALAVATIGYVGAQEKARQEDEQRARTLVDLSRRYDELQKVLDTGERGTAGYNQAAQEQEQLIKQIGNQFPQLVARWNEHGEAIKLNTALLRENTAAAQENVRKQNEAALEKAKQAVESLRRTKEDLQKQLDMADQPLSGAQRGLFSQASGLGFGDQSQGFFTKSAEALKADLATANAELAKAMAEYQRTWAMLHPSTMGQDTGYLDPNGPPREPTAPSGQVYDPDAAKAAAEAEKQRLAAIRDQMDLLRHLVTMDDQRVDTTAEQLQWLEHIRDTLGATRDLDEAIYELQKQIAREPLQEQLDAFEQRKRIGEVTARQEQEFYEGLLARSKELNLSERERQEYEVRAVAAKKAAVQELNQRLMEAYRTEVEMNDLTTQQQVDHLDLVRLLFAEGSKERKELDLEYHRLNKQLQQENHQAKLAEIEFDAVMGRWSNEQKLQALREYLNTATNLTLEQRRSLQMQVAQMEQQQERANQTALLDLFRQGLEMRRRLEEANLRARYAPQMALLQDQMAETAAMYDAAIAAEQRKLEKLQNETREIERQNRLLEIQNRIKDVDQELADVRALRNRVVIGEDGVARRTYDEARERELLEEKADLEKQYADEQDRQERERQQEKIQRRIADLQQERAEALAALQQQLQDLQKKQDEELTALNGYWDERMKTQNIQQELERLGWQTHYDEVLKKTKQWVTDMNTEWAKLQQPVFDKGSDLSKQLGGNTGLPGGTTQPGAGQAGGANGGQTIEVNQYGNHNYYGAQGVEQAVSEMAGGFGRTVGNYTRR